MGRLKITIQWTDTAKNALPNLPKKVRHGLFQKIDALQEGDPRIGQKPLLGPLQGYYRVTYSRYRALFSAQEEELAKGLLHIKVTVVLVGIRKADDKKNVYEIAKKLIKLGLIPGRGE